MAVDPLRLAEIILEFKRPVTFLGDGVPVYGAKLRDALGSMARLAPMAASFPRAAAIAELGLSAFREGRGVDPSALQPEYIRPSEAELTWQRKNCPGSEML
jgi:tRNA threonylcarbamoyladenosine biosynthesis protein TsaB